MKQIKCPDTLSLVDHGAPTVFLAGGITCCPDWQAEIMDMLKFHDLRLLNPRRDDFDYNDSAMAKRQIEWEYRHLRMCSTVLFWFPEETLCPITLFELGVYSDCNIVVGCHPNYARKFDIVKQLSLIRPDIKVVFSLSDLVEQLEIAL